MLHALDQHGVKGLHIGFIAVGIPGPCGRIKKFAQMMRQGDRSWQRCKAKTPGEEYRDFEGAVEPLGCM